MADLGHRVNGGFDCSFACEFSMHRHSRRIDQGHTKDAALMLSHKRLESPPVASQYLLHEGEIVLIRTRWFDCSSFCIVNT